jgi:hypothetical protein
VSTYQTLKQRKQRTLIFPDPSKGKEVTKITVDEIETLEKGGPTILLI